MASTVSFSSTFRLNRYIWVGLILLLVAFQYDRFVSISMYGGLPGWSDLSVVSPHANQSLQENNHRLRSDEVNFLEYRKGDHPLVEHDLFAAAWWQSVDRFLKFDPNTIGIVEDNVFSPVKRTAGGYADARMTVDWLDFSLEHLSRYWKLASSDLQGHPALQFVMQKLQSFVASACKKWQQHQQQQQQQSGIMQSTLVIIPLGLSGNPSQTEQKLWQLAIQGTIAALLRHAPARVVLVGFYPADAQNAAMAYNALATQCTGQTQRPQVAANNFFEASLTSQTTLAYVRAHSNVTTRYIPQNIPKGALHDLHLALGGQSDITGNNVQQTTVAQTNPQEFRRLLRRQYLGEDAGDSTPQTRFKYVYMTESDQILHARPTPQFMEEMDNGRIIIPYRLQPIPHSFDLKGVVASKMLPESLFPPENVVVLDYETSSCCDTGEHLFIGRHDPRKPGCGDVWWRCGFHATLRLMQAVEKNGMEATLPAIQQNFAHFKDYEFMRLASGTSIVSLAANEWSRRCKPVTEGRRC